MYAVRKCATLLWLLFFELGISSGWALAQDRLDPLIKSIDILTKSLAEFDGDSAEVNKQTKALTDELTKLRSGEALTAALTAQVEHIRRNVEPREPSEKNKFEADLENLAHQILNFHRLPDHDVLARIASLNGALTKHQKYLKHPDVQTALKALSTKIEGFLGPSADELARRITSLNTAIKGTFKPFLSVPKVKTALEALKKTIKEKQQAAASQPGSSQPGSSSGKKITIIKASYGDHALEASGRCRDRSYKPVWAGSAKALGYRRSKYFLPNDYSHVRDVYSGRCICNAKSYLKTFCSDQIHKIRGPKNPAKPKENIEKFETGEIRNQYCEIAVDNKLCFNRDPSPDSVAKSLRVKYHCGNPADWKKLEAWEGTDAADLILLCNS